MLLKKLTFFFIMLVLFIWPSKFISNANFNMDFEPSCESLLLFNTNSNSIVYSKNPDKKMYPASITKIMTYIVTAENVSDFENTVVTVKKSILNSLLGTGGALSGIKPNETLSVNQLLHCLMIKSGNDAALILADFVGQGDIGKFVDMMNDKSTELGCRCTHFMNPHGLFEEDHYTTASDLLKITNYAMALPGFMEISSKVTSSILGDDRYPLVTTNSMIDPVRGGKYYYKYTKGIKTGYEKLAGRCLVSSAVNGEYSYICIALGGMSETENQAMLDSKNLYKWAFNNLKLKAVMDKEKPLGETKLNFAWGKDTIQLYPASDYSAVLPKDVMASSINVKIDAPSSVNAPVKAGQKIGVAMLSYANNDIATIDLVAGENVKINYFLFIIQSIRNLFSSIWVKIAFFALLLFVGFYVLIFLKSNKAKRNAKRKAQKARSRYRYKR